MLKFYPSLFVLLAFLANYPSLQGQVYGRNGMVVSDNALASQIGIAILQKGGNAIDASVATAFALAVCHPQAGNIGGGGFLVFRDSSGMATTIDFREKAPLAATPQMFLDSAGRLIPASNHYGAKSIGVPGTVAGLWLAHQNYGRLPWRDVVQPAIDLALKGFPLSYTLDQHAQNFQKDEDRPSFLKDLFKDEEGHLLQFGEVWQQKELAQTLSFIRDKGKDGFYAGSVAEEIEDFMKASGGLITKEDLARYQAIERKPLYGSYKGYELITMPPPSSGGLALLEMLNIMELVHWDTIEFNSADYLHLQAEAMRSAFADRAYFLGDPDFNPEMPLSHLLSKAHAQSLFEQIDFNRATVSDSSSFNQLYEGDQTTHLSVVDKNGAAVSLTYTLEYSYGSGLGSEKLGFLFNNEMGDFNPIPGYTNSKGLIGTPPNTIAPEKRMLSSMSPTIVCKEGKPYLIIGSPGGRTIINTVFQTVFCVLEYEMPLEQAIPALKIHHQYLPDRIVYERDLLSPDTRKILALKGHSLYPVQNLGRLMGILCSQSNGVYIGYADGSSPDGAAVAY